MSTVIGTVLIVGLAALVVYFGYGVGKEIYAKVKQSKQNKKDK